MNFIKWFTEKAIPNNINRIFLYSELGGGKTTALKKLLKNLTDNYNDYRLIPIYIDCREMDYESKMISNSILSKYAPISDGEVDKNRIALLKNCFLSNEYKYLIILDCTDLLNSDTVEDVYEELENLCVEHPDLFMIFANSNEKRFNETIFQKCNFKKVALKSLNLYDSSVVENNAEIQNLDYNTKTMLSLPYFFSKYCSYKNDRSVVNEFNLIDKYVDGILHTGIRSEGSEAFSYRQTLLKEIIPPLVFECTNGVIKLQNSVHNQMKTSDLSILKLVNNGDIESQYIISHEIIHSYFCEQYLYNVFEKNKDEFLNLINTKILDDLTLKLFGQRLEITNENRKNTELYKVIDVIRHMDKHKQIDYSNALNNILRVFCLTCSEQLAGFDLSELDLRLCCFIGVDCSGVSFENSICTDECFAPVEPENADIFSISENGRYFITGNKDVLNIRETKSNILIDRLLADEGNGFTYAESWGDDYFYARQKNNALYITIKDYSIDSSIAYDTNDEDEKSNSLLESIPQSIKKFGIPCCVENGHVLVKTDVNSIYSSAYLLFDLQSENLISVCKYHTHVLVSNIVQDGDEIEFLFENDGKPLKSICYNEKTKEIYIKEYLTLVNRWIECKKEIQVHIDTQNIGSFLKWYFFKNSLKHCVYNKYNVLKASDLSFISFNNFDYKIYTRKRYLELISPCTPYTLKFFNGKNIITKDNGYSHEFSDFEFSSKDYIAEFDENYLIKFVNVWNENYNFFVKPKYLHHYNFIFNSINIRNYDDGYQLVLGNDVYDLLFTPKKEFSLKYSFSYHLTFTNEYLCAINSFPWKDTMEKIMNATALLQSSVLQQCCKSFEFRYPYYKKYSTYFFDYIHLFIMTQHSRFNFVDFYDIDSLTNDDFIIGYKNWCCPFDDGVIYYNGETSCCLRINENGIINEKRFYNIGPYFFANNFNNGVHYFTHRDMYNVSCFYTLVDIYKDVYDNIKDNIRIPIYDLKLFNANIENINGLSGVVKNIVERQTIIETHNVAYNE